MLSPDQIAARRGRLTASRVACVMRGDGPAIANLWLELIDDPTFVPPANYPPFVPENFDDNWPVQLGIETEALNLRWYEKKGNRVSRRGEVVIHPTDDRFACTLDGWDDDLRCPIEVKHTGGREPLEVVAERYMPQMHWQMEITQSGICALSVIMGASPPIVEYIDRDDAYIAEMLKRGLQFMQHVANRTPPVVLDPVPAPIVADRTVDMSNNETWARHASQWLQVKGAADTARECEKVLKSLVPEDCKKAWGWGARVTRDRAGRMSLREDTQ